MMELVINIPKTQYKTLIAKTQAEVVDVIDDKVLIDAIKHGIPLPIGHGRLIDADTLKKDDEVTEWLSLNAVRTGKMLKIFSELFIKKIDAAKTIIKADTESEDKE